MQLTAILNIGLAFIKKLGLFRNTDFDAIQSVIDESKPVIFEAFYKFWGFSPPPEYWNEAAGRLQDKNKHTDNIRILAQFGVLQEGLYGYAQGKVTIDQIYNFLINPFIGTWQMREMYVRKLAIYGKDHLFNTPPDSQYYTYPPTNALFGSNLTGETEEIFYTDLDWKVKEAQDRLGITPPKKQTNDKSLLVIAALIAMITMS